MHGSDYASQAAAGVYGSIPPHTNTPNISSDEHTVQCNSTEDVLRSILGMMILVIFLAIAYNLIPKDALPP